MSWYVCYVRRAGIVCLLALLGAATMSEAQQTTVWPEAQPSDVASIDAVMKSAYEAVSARPGEERDLDRFRSLWRPGSRLVMVSQTADGEVSSTVLTLDDFARVFSGPVAEGVYEREAARRTEVFGNMAHVWSTYEIRNTPEGELGVRGINSLQLVHDGGRWWFVAGLFQNEGPGAPLPNEYTGE
jgi:hypothetical protein